MAIDLIHNMSIYSQALSDRLQEHHLLQVRKTTAGITVTVEFRLAGGKKYSRLVVLRPDDLTAISAGKLAKQLNRETGRITNIGGIFFSEI